MARIATAIRGAAAQFFAENQHDSVERDRLPLSENEISFLTQMRRYSSGLNGSDRDLLLTMVKKMAAE